MALLFFIGLQVLMMIIATGMSELTCMKKKVEWLRSWLARHQMTIEEEENLLNELNKKN